LDGGHVVVEGESRGETKDGVIVVDGVAVVIGMSCGPGDSRDLFSPLTDEEIVISSNNSEVGSRLTSNTMSSSDDLVSTDDGASTAVVPT